MTEKLTPVAVARYTDSTFLSKEYIVDDNGSIRCFISIESAKNFLQSILQITEEQLDWFLYDPIHICDKCSSPSLDASRMFVMNTSTVCEHCYYDPL